MGFLAKFRAAVLSLLGVGAMTAAAAEFSGQCRVIFDPALKPEDARRISETGQFPAGSKVMEFRLDADGTFLLENLCGKFTPLTDAAVVLFTVTADRDGVTSLGMGSDWWHSCFANGAEIGTSEPAGNDTWPPTPDDFRWRLPLRKGRNFVAVHLRPGKGSWRFACKLKPLPDVSAWPKEESARRVIYEMLFPGRREIRRGPLVSRISRDRAAVSVELATPACAGLVLRKGGKGEGRVIYASVHGRAPIAAIHRFEIDGLDPATDYTYELFCHDPRNGAKEPLGGGRFRTFPATGSTVRFAAVSDLQLSEARRLEVMRGFCANTDLLKEDFFVALGDVASNFHDFGSIYFDTCLDVLYRERKSTLPFVPVRGNHEFRGGETEHYGKWFGTPYYAFRYGDIFFFVLDTVDQKKFVRMECDYWRNDFAGYLREQAAWLKRVVASEECRTAKYRVVLAHTPPFAWESPEYTETLNMLIGDFIYGESPRCPIDLWLCAHVHIPYRYDPVRRELAGAARRVTAKKTLKMTPEDLRNIRFPVFVNDGPRSTGAGASLTQVEMRDGVMTVSCVTPAGKVLDKVKFRRGEAFEVEQTTYLPYPR